MSRKTRASVCVSGSNVDIRANIKLSSCTNMPRKVIEFRNKGSSSFVVVITNVLWLGGAASATLCGRHGDSSSTVRLFPKFLRQSIGVPNEQQSYWFRDLPGKNGFTATACERGSNIYLKTWLGQIKCSPEDAVLNIPWVTLLCVGRGHGCSPPHLRTRHVSSRMHTTPPVLQSNVVTPANTAIA